MKKMYSTPFINIYEIKTDYKIINDFFNFICGDVFFNRVFRENKEDLKRVNK